MTTDINKVRKMIRDLRNKTVNNGCTEAEAMAAMTKAFELMAKYNLKDGDIENDQIRVNSYAARRSVADALWPVVAKVCSCHVYLERSDRLCIVYTGRPADTAVAEYLHALLAAAIKRETDIFRTHPEYTKRRKQKTRNAAVKAFQVELVHRLAGRLGELWWREAKASGDVEKFFSDYRRNIARIEQDIARRGIEFGKSRDLRKPDARFKGARAAGYAAGGSVKLEPGVSSGSNQRMLGN